MIKEEFSPAEYLGRSVKEMRPEQQPRERMMKYGAESLSDAELLAILLRTGTKGLNVVETARAMLSRFNGLRNLSKQNWQALKVIPGIAGVKAITLEAVFELSKRIQTASLGDEVIISCPEDAAALFTPMLRDLHYEVFYIAFLNNSKILTGMRKVSSGGSTSTIVDVAEIVRQAVLNRANSILIAHNHPSGYAKESAADINLTKRTGEALRLVGITLDDHIIIAGDQFISMRSKNLIR